MITIGFTRATDEEKYQLYVKWLKSIDPSFEYINFYRMDIPDALEALDNCSGLVLTGGADIHPAHYGKGEEENRCETDPDRDILEFALIEKSIELKIPLLAICRGEQVLNVSQGGDLIVDLPVDHGTTVIHSSDTDKLINHKVNIDITSNLYRIIRKTSFDIVSVHHQAVRTLAPCFRPTAFAEDGIIEAFEWLNPDGKGYLNAVQWHPEKGDFHNALSQAIAKDFIDKACSFTRL
ncbi:MAG TPA: gamma-glutamyl-gamma-aminobutyrate hydrolase [Bacteroidales bacterium]|nr:gamma-glutamyl-gamma-aminobutyrate hydrolase [Bacteroidales bacterium]HBZ20651.1 gamma-glutamyl-gamma-aminobutyrate hydrolase [Bacteroidales bacterium]